VPYYAPEGGADLLNAYDFMKTTAQTKPRDYDFFEYLGYTIPQYK